MNMTILDLCIKYALPTLSSGLDKMIVIISHNRAVWANYDENSKKNLRNLRKIIIYYYQFACISFYK